MGAGDFAGIPDGGDEFVVAALDKGAAFVGPFEAAPESVAGAVLEFHDPGEAFAVGVLVGVGVVVAFEKWHAAEEAAEAAANGVEAVGHGGDGCRVDALDAELVWVVAEGGDLEPVVLQ